MRRTEALAVSAVLLAGCSVTAPSSSSSEAQRVVPAAPASEPGSAAAASRTWHLPWGTGPGAVGLRPAAEDALAEGPSAIAVTGDSIAILDRRNERVLGLDAAGATTRAVAPADAELLAAADDGALALYSPLRSRVWLLDPTGSAAGELAVPRVIRDIVSLHLGASRRIELSTALQDTLPIGSPRFPLALPVVLASREEGAARLGASRLRVVREGAATKLELVEPRGERPTPLARVALRRAEDAAQLIGVDGRVACVRTESIREHGALEVERRAVCIDVDRGEERLTVALPAPGVYLPRQELAVGAGRLVFMHPTEAGLAVTAWAIPGGGGR